MKYRVFALVLFAVMLFSLLTACGSSSVEETVPPTESAQSSSDSVSSDLSAITPVQSTEKTAPFEPSSSPSLPMSVLTTVSLTPAPVPTPEPQAEEPVDPASHIFPDLEAFFGLPLEKDQAYNARGWRWQFEDLHPYDQLEAVKDELLALLQEPRWQLELVDEQHSVYETGDMNGSDGYYFKYTGTAELTQIEDYLGVRLDHVNVFFYHTAAYDKYSIDIFRSPELEAVDPGSRISADVGEPEKEDISGDNDFWEKCSACHGSGDCTHCSGSGTVRNFQAGLGWVKQDCTLCNRGKCRYCNGTGKD